MKPESTPTEVLTRTLLKLSDQMSRAASQMAKLSLSRNDPLFNARLLQHAGELSGASALARSWAEEIRRKI